MGLAACFILSSLLVAGITTQRTAACAAAAVLGAVIYTRTARVAWLLLVLSAAAWCVVAFSPVARRVSDGVVHRNPVPQSVDAVVVLSGGVTHDGMLEREALDRLLTGVALLRSGHATTIVITRPHPLGNKSITTDADQRRIIALLPVQPRIIVVDSVVSTRTEALAMGIGVRLQFSGSSRCNRLNGNASVACYCGTPSTGVSPSRATHAWTFLVSPSTSSNGATIASRASFANRTTSVTCKLCGNSPCENIAPCMRTCS